ncbi:hypothetical protein CHG84_18180 [Salmonella enterica]|nr:hypothetical protein [Salmonella enterica]
MIRVQFKHHHHPD